MSVLRVAFPYLLFASLVLLVVIDRRSGGNEVRADGGAVLAAPSAAGGPRTGRDPICAMDVGDRLTAVHGGERWFFCSEKCRETFLAAPARYTAASCLVCRVDEERRTPVAAGSPALTWQGTTYLFCGPAHRDRFAADPAGYFVHSMWGLPPWLYAVSVALVLVLSFGLFEIVARRDRGGEPRPARIDLFQIPGLRRLLRHPATRPLGQLALAAVFVLIVLAGLYGDQLPSRNVAPLLTWTIWWGGLVVLILFAGKAWCYVCPWDAIAGWIEKVGLGRRRSGLSLGLSWPRRLRNIWLATGFFVFLTWLELGFGVTMNPRATAVVALGMLTLALVTVLVFERRAFCRYACLVGRVSGLYALFAAAEVRPVDPGRCRACATKDCYGGNERGEPCPTGLFPAALTENTYCINCLECVKTCPEANMTVRIRPWGGDLAGEGRPRKDEAYLALLMLSITGFHGLTMTAAWRDAREWIEDALHLPYVPAFTLGMAAIMLGPLLIYAALVKAAVLLSRTREVGYGKAFVRFAYCVLPIALFYHLAHNLEHLLMEGQKVIPILSNPFGFAPGERWSVLGITGTGPWNLFGTAAWSLPPLIDLPTLWLLQVLLVLVGHVYSLWIADRTARRLYPRRGDAFRSQLPMLAGMVLFSIFSLWLLKQPMEMRTSAM
ncbi:MAG: YHS domain-containing protein [Planctomycetota bacterium]